MNIGILRPSTLPKVIMEVEELGILTPETLPLVITDDMLVEVDLVHKRTFNLNPSIGGQELMLKGKVDTGLIPATIPPITKFIVVDFSFHHYLHVI